MIRLAALITILLGLALPALAGPALVETPIYQQDVAAGKLPPVAQRVPQVPSVVDMAAEGKEPGRSGARSPGWLPGPATSGS